jgi:hypothetical protein
MDIVSPVMFVQDVVKRMVEANSDPVEYLEEIENGITAIWRDLEADHGITRSRGEFD